jgi:translation initiation factor 2 gamma subunit (eIF-2gamma)
MQLATVCVPKRNLKIQQLISIIRSYNIKFREKGGVASRGISQGVLEIGMKVVIVLGIIQQNEHHYSTYQPIHSRDKLFDTSVKRTIISI